MNLLSTNEAAERLQVTPQRVRALILAGKLPSQKIGRDHVVSEADLALVAERKVGRPAKVKSESESVPPMTDVKATADESLEESAPKPKRRRKKAEDAPEIKPERARTQTKKRAS